MRGSVTDKFLAEIFRHPTSLAFGIVPVFKPLRKCPRALSHHAMKKPRLAVFSLRDERLETYSFSTGCRYFISTTSQKIAGNLFSPLAYKTKHRQQKVVDVLFGAR